MSRLRQLHLAVIEDWWYEIASLMDQSSETCDRIDQEELEYVKRMVQSGGIRVRLEWLRVKIMIVRYFKEVSRRSDQQVEVLEEAKSEGEIVQY